MARKKKRAASTRAERPEKDKERVSAKLSQQEFEMVVNLVAERHFLNTADFVRSAVWNELLRLGTAGVIGAGDEARESADRNRLLRNRRL